MNISCENNLTFDSLFKKTYLSNSCAAIEFDAAKKMMKIVGWELFLGAGRILIVDFLINFVLPFHAHTRKSLFLIGFGLFKR
jgi:hypothetical protein